MSDLSRPTIFYLSTADTELLALARAVPELPPEFPAVRAANPAALGPADTERLLAEVEASAGLVVTRLLGGKRAFEAGFARLERACLARGAPFIALPGDQQPDLDLAASTTAPAEVTARVFEYLLHGGIDNFRQLLRYLSDALLGSRFGFEPPQPLPWHGLYRPSAGLRQEGPQGGSDRAADRKGRQPVTAADLELLELESAASPLEEAIGRKGVERYEQALARLKPAERDLVIAKVELGYSYAELADAFDKPSTEAARKAAQRALVRLAEEMRHERRP